VSSTVRPIIVTADLDRLLAFYGQLVDAVELHRMPAEGAPFYVGVRVGDSELGLVSDDSVQAGTPQRMLLSIDVPDVDALLDRVSALGGRVLGPPTDTPWGQRVVHLHDPDGNTVNLTQELAR
jgi:predicted enzyme related to lactoylglutathione lyase